MMHFRKKSNLSNGEKDSNEETKISKDDADRLKVRTASVADPILDAVQEAQPFEQANDNGANRQSYYTDENNILHDIFGQPIQQPDISNPTRDRDERPLDTIRSFEYAISGDPIWAQQLETPQYGFRVRPDFPNFGNGNPYDNNMGQPNQQMFGEQGVYQPPAVPTGEAIKKKKKKFSLFGKKKK